MAIRRKLEFVFRINQNIKKFDVENLKNLFLFHGLLYYLSEKRIKIWGHQTNSLSVGPNITPPHTPGRVAQSVTCLATDASLAADPGVASSIPARSHTFVEIDHEIVSTVILLPSAESFKKGCCQLQAKVCARSTG